MKNPCLKTRKPGNPYEVWEGCGIKYEVLKKYQVDDNKPYARWFVNAIGPYPEMGDMYVAEVKRFMVRTFVDPTIAS